jgi:hypothetical protein
MLIALALMATSGCYEVSYDDDDDPPAADAGDAYGTALDTGTPTTDTEPPRRDVSQTSPPNDTGWGASEDVSVPYEKLWGIEVVRLEQSNIVQLEARSPNRDLSGRVIEQTEDGSLLVGGSTVPKDMNKYHPDYDANAFVSKIGPDGRERWRRTWGEPDKDESVETISVMDDGKIAYGYRVRTTVREVVVGSFEIVTDSGVLVWNSPSKFEGVPGLVSDPASSNFYVVAERQVEEYTPDHALVQGWDVPRASDPDIPWVELNEYALVGDDQFVSVGGEGVCKTRVVRGRGAAVEQWSKHFASTFQNTRLHGAFASDGSVYVSTPSGGTTGGAITTGKYDSDGNLVWRDDFEPSAFFTSNYSGMVVDSNGRLMILVSEKLLLYEQGGDLTKAGANVGEQGDILLDRQRGRLLAVSKDGLVSAFSLDGF